MLAAMLTRPRPVDQRGCSDAAATTSWSSAAARGSMMAVSTAGTESGVGHRTEARTPPPSSTTPAAIFVPPMSTPIVSVTTPPDRVLSAAFLR
jgi:hypothetical protein